MFTRSSLHRFVSPLLIIAIVVAVYLPTERTPRAQAIAAVIVGGNGTVQESITAGATTITAGLQNILNMKEIVLDPIFNGLAKAIVQSMTQSIVNWINSGFQGSPAFVTDLKQYLLGQLDAAAGQMIYNDPSLNFLCSPFQLDVKVALATSYRETSRDGLQSAQCTLSDVTDNIQGFLNGSFSEGGWGSWFELTQNPVNTPTGARLAAEGEMYARLIDEQGNAVKELDWGSGFLSFKVCADTDNKKNCDITTPGRVIADQLNKSLGAGQDALITADEINEIISALLAQLAKQALTGINGLLGLGGSSYSDNSFGSSGNSSYLDALGSENSAVSGISDPFTTGIERENENIQLQQQIIQKITAVESAIKQATAGCFSGNLSLPASLVTRRSDAQTRITVDQQHIATLTSMKTQFTAATDVQEQLNLVTQLNSMQQNGSLTGLTENTMLDVYIKTTLEDETSTLYAQASAIRGRCDR